MTYRSLSTKQQFDGTNWFHISVFFVFQKKTFKEKTPCLGLLFVGEGFREGSSRVIARNTY